MNVKKALRLKAGDIIRIPADRGKPAGTATVQSAPTGPVYKNIKGTEYIWINCGADGVWPSNRI